MNLVDETNHYFQSTDWAVQTFSIKNQVHKVKTQTSAYVMDILYFGADFIRNPTIL